MADMNFSPDSAEYDLMVGERAPNLKMLAQRESGREWLANLPRLLAELAELWGLQLGEVFPNSTVSYVVAATRGSEAVVLKIQWPHSESAMEADALKLWQGHGAVRLLEHDAQRHALLLERCIPGTPLSKSPAADAMGVMTDLLPRLFHGTEKPFQLLTAEANHWADGMAHQWRQTGKPCEWHLVEQAIAYCHALAATQPELVLVHQDLHGDNVLASERGWLAIDPKPLVGELAFGLSPVIRSFEFGHNEVAVLNRIDRLTSELNIDRQRAMGWAVAQSVAWSFDSAYAERHYQTARWILKNL